MSQRVQVCQCFPEEPIWLFQRWLMSVVWSATSVINVCWELDNYNFFNHSLEFSICLRLKLTVVRKTWYDLWPANHNGGPKLAQWHVSTNSRSGDRRQPAAKFRFQFSPKFRTKFSQCDCCYDPQKLKHAAINQWRTHKPNGSERKKKFVWRKFKT